MVADISNRTSEWFITLAKTYFR